MTQLGAAMVVAAALAMAGAGPAHAQSIQALGEELKAATARLPALNQTMAQAAESNLALDAEYKAAAAEQATKSAALKQAVAEQLRTVKAPLERKIAAESEAYNAHCAESRVGKLEPVSYQDCLTRKAQAEKDIAAQRQQWSAHAAQWNAEHVKPVNAAIARANARMADISTQMKANVARYTEAQDSFLATRQRIDRDLVALKRLCDPQTTSSAETPFTEDERATWCKTIDVKGYAATLPAIYAAKGSGEAAAGK